MTHQERIQNAVIFIRVSPLPAILSVVLLLSMAAPVSLISHTGTCCSLRIHMFRTHLPIHPVHTFPTAQLTP